MRRTSFSPNPQSLQSPPGIPRKGFFPSYAPPTPPPGTQNIGSNSSPLTVVRDVRMLEKGDEEGEDGRGVKFCQEPKRKGKRGSVGSATKVVERSTSMTLPKIFRSTASPPLSVPSSNPPQLPKENERNPFISTFSPSRLRPSYSLVSPLGSPARSRPSVPPPIHSPSPLPPPPPSSTPRDCASPPQGGGGSAESSIPSSNNPTSPSQLPPLELPRSGLPLPLASRTTTTPPPRRNRASSCSLSCTRLISSSSTSPTTPTTSITPIFPVSPVSPVSPISPVPRISPSSSFSSSPPSLSFCSSPSNSFYHQQKKSVPLLPPPLLSLPPLSQTPVYFVSERTGEIKEEDEGLQQTLHGILLKDLMRLHPEVEGMDEGGGLAEKVQAEITRKGGRLMTSSKNTPRAKKTQKLRKN